MIQIVAPYFGPSAFKAMIWTGQAIATVFVVARLSIRYSALRRLCLDDYFVLLALLGQLLLTSLETMSIDAIYGLSLNGASMTIPCLILSYFASWAVKLSFLVFYKRFWGLRQSKRTVWWMLLGVVVATMVVHTGLSVAVCPYTDTTKCEMPNGILYNVDIWLVLAMDVGTDLLLIAYAVWLIYEIHLPKSQKVGLTILFSLSFVSIVMNIIRAVVSIGEVTTTAYAWAWLWCHFANDVAIIVASLVAFRLLATRKRHDGKTQNGTSNSNSTFPRDAASRTKLSYPSSTDSSTINSTLVSSSASDEQLLEDRMRFERSGGKGLRSGTVMQSGLQEERLEMGERQQSARQMLIPRAEKSATGRVPSWAADWSPAAAKIEKV